MGTTPNYELPYPGPGEPPDGPSQIQALAEATDDALADPQLVGDLTVPAGDVHIGAGTDTTAHALYLDRLVGTSERSTWRIGRTLGATDHALVIHHYLNDVLTDVQTVYLRGALSITREMAVKRLLTVGDSANVTDYWTSATRLQRLVAAGKLSVATLGIVDEFTPLGIDLNVAGTPGGRVDLIGSASGPRINLSAPDGTVRPLPFAMAADVKPLTLTNATYATLVVNWPTGRFTQAPVVSVNVVHNSAVYGPLLWSSSAASATVGARHYDGTVTTATVSLNVMAMQMLPGTTPGLRADQAHGADPNGASTCHVEDCGNDGVEVPGYFEAITEAWCGACGNEITDVTRPGQLDPARP